MENFIIGPMTPWGPFVTGFVGLFFAFVLYGLIMKYPAGKDSVVKIGDQIHLGAKVFMLTEYKILAPVVVALVVATTSATTTGARILYSVSIKTFAPKCI